MSTKKQFISIMIFVLIIASIMAMKFAAGNLLFPIIRDMFNSIF
ncbi:anion ABC superfamily ATP binding cassette transporter permease protein [Sporosarcina newyorkensis 2681]|uniref:Uncharacterized protein n=2 Tax=Sporosarcina newyorkensis TaxID=759851 RepID=A0A1T4XU42_9BACL|nr:anion ABC superfamily ATP binding cassette transporter permease protein [Sporosarcina newyorkensis 2681]SKA92605.1 hypothetical protein SAMN04244570_1326 [Sporosarcina newyorkensis]